jgi:hypothetical protein
MVLLYLYNQHLLHKSITKLTYHLTLHMFRSKWAVIRVASFQAFTCALPLVLVRHVM